MQRSPRLLSKAEAPVHVLIIARPCKSHPTRLSSATHPSIAPLTTPRPPATSAWSFPGTTHTGNHARPGPSTRPGPMARALPLAGLALSSAPLAARLPPSVATSDVTDTSSSLTTSSSASRAQTTKTKVLYINRKLSLPAILFIPGKSKNEQDPNQLLYLCPELALAKDAAKAAREDHTIPHEAKAGGKHAAHYWVHAEREGFLLGYPISSCGRNEAEKVAFLRQVGAGSRLGYRIVPLDTVSHAAVKVAGTAHPASTLLLSLQNPKEVPGRSRDISGFLLLTPRSATFSSSSLHYYTPHSFEVEEIEAGRLKFHLKFLEKQEGRETVGGTSAGSGSGGRVAGGRTRILGRVAGARTRSRGRAMGGQTRTPDCAAGGRTQTWGRVAGWTRSQGREARAGTQSRGRITHGQTAVERTRTRDRTAGGRMRTQDRTAAGRTRSRGGEARVGTQSRGQTVAERTQNRVDRTTIPAEP
ncbi:hypothetical protein B0H19DRAFT_135084 [Mycena capillaripes]|nr:hypothetical protein B0H19DRAFT_135084 [Mycena capillaripes]